MVVGLGGTQHLDSAVPVSLAGTMTRSRCTLIAVIKPVHAVPVAYGGKPQCVSVRGRFRAYVLGDYCESHELRPNFICCHRRQTAARVVWRERSVKHTNDSLSRMHACQNSPHAFWHNNATIL